MPFVRPLIKLAATAQETAEIPGLVDEAIRTALGPALGADVPRLPARRGVQRGRAPDARAGCRPPRRGRPLTRARSSAPRRCCATPSARRSWPGPGCTGATGRTRCVRSPRQLRIPVFLNGLARGCVAADHELFFSRARGTGLGGADVALVIGVPLDFRLGFGAAFAPDAEIVAIDVAEPRARPPAAGRRRAVRGAAGDARSAVRRGRRPERRDGCRARALARVAVASTRTSGERPRSRERDGPARAASPDARYTASWPRCSTGTRSWSATAATSSRYAGRVVDSYLPGCWLDPGRSGAWAPAPATRSPPSSPAPTSRSCCCSATARSASRRWSSTRWPATGSPVRRGGGQQRHLGPREAPDGVPVRLLGRGRPAPGDALRRGRARRSDATASWCPSPRSCGPRSSARCSPASPRWSTCSPTRRWPTRDGRTWRSGSRHWRRNENRPLTQRAASDPGLAQSGRAGVRARKGRLDWLGRREAPMSAASPEPMLETSQTGSTANHSPNQTPEQSNIRPVPQLPEWTFIRCEISGTVIAAMYRPESSLSGARLLQFSDSLACDEAELGPLPFGPSPPQRHLIEYS